MPRLGLGSSLTGGSISSELTLAGASAITNNYSLLWDGNGDGVKIDAASITHNFFSGSRNNGDGTGGTLSLWFTMHNAGQNTYGKLFTKQGDNDSTPSLALQTDGNRRILWSFPTTEGSPSSTAGNCDLQHTFSTSLWYNFVMVYDMDDVTSAQPKCYIDGSEETVTSTRLGGGEYASNDDDSSNHIYIGNYWNEIRSWDGNIDEVSMWNRKLSDAEVASLYNSGIPTDLEGINGLIGWWRMEEGTGTTVADSSGNGNDGAFIGNPTWSAITPDD